MYVDIDIDTDMDIYIYIYMVPPPHVPTPVCSVSALGRHGVGSWDRGSACKSYVSSLCLSTKLSP